MVDIIFLLFMFGNVSSFYYSNTFLQLRRGSNQSMEITDSLLKECSRSCRPRPFCFGFVIREFVVNKTGEVEYCELNMITPSFPLNDQNHYFAKNLFNTRITSFNETVNTTIHNKMRTSDDYVETMKELFNDCKCPVSRLIGNIKNIVFDVRNTTDGNECPYAIFGKNATGLQTIQDPYSVYAKGSWENAWRAVCVNKEWYVISTHPYDAHLVRVGSILYRDGANTTCSAWLLDPSLCYQGEICCDQYFIRAAVLETFPNSTSWVRGLHSCYRQLHSYGLLYEISNNWKRHRGYERPDGYRDQNALHQ